MSHPEGRHLGIGDVDDARLAQAIALISRSNGLPRQPLVDEVFSREFLPPLTERETGLARD
ncbi:hypothetical protein D3C80_2225050 [compost metagenome]